jgi:hypothetical protein
MTQPLTIQAVSTTTLDEYGDQVPGDDGAPVSVYGYLHQVQTDETLVDRDTVVSKWTCYLPAGTAISHLDYINFEGQKFQVNGEPHKVWNPRRAVTSHIEVDLIVVNG